MESYGTSIRTRKKVPVMVFNYSEECNRQVFWNMQIASSAVSVHFCPTEISRTIGINERC